MSKAGQYTFTGISDEADIALLYLLRACKRSDFQRIIIEGKGWEDFTLVFDDHNEDYEVKSYRRSLSYADIRSIVAKELTKQYGEKDIFKIIIKKVSRKFRDDYEYIRKYLYLIQLKELSKDAIVEKLLSKRWLIDEIFFLSKVEIIEFKKIENIHKLISEYFALEDPFYLSEQDQESIVARSFRRIMQKGKQGGTITRKDFLDTLNIFKKNIVEKSESFSPDKDLGEKVGKIKQFLSSENKLKGLFAPKYLSPISSTPRLIFYLADKLEQTQFHANSFILFIKNILLKQDYVGLTFRILEKKRAQNKIDDEYLLNFLITNYKKLFYDFNYDDALRIIKKIVEKDTQGLFVDKVLNFLKKQILIPFKEKVKRREEKRKKRWAEVEQVAGIAKIFFGRTENKKDFINFIFDYFDFTGDDFENVVETNPLVYCLVKDFIKENLLKNFDYVVRKISAQFNDRCDGKYKGYEWMGHGITQFGSSYSITDKGVVRLLFEPLFAGLYESNSEKAWKFFKERVLNKAMTRATKNNPIYLKRALISILLNRLENEKLNTKEKEKTFEYLKNILRMKEGIPQSSEIIFHKLQDRDLKKIGFNKVMELIDVDSVKYKRKDYPAGYPTNLFVISTLINLIKLKYIPAKDFFISLIKKPDFIMRDYHYDSFELLVREGIPESDPDFIVEISNKFNLEQYLNSSEREDVWGKSGIITGVVKKDWQEGKNRGNKIVNSLLKGKIPSKNVLEFLGGSIRSLAQTDALKTYELFRSYLEDKKIFKSTFQNNKYTRQNINWLADELAKQKHYEKAKIIVELCIEDYDPETHNREEDFNYHLQVKQGKEQINISTVRGTIPWVLQKFAVSNDPELMKYALEKTKILLDLDGELTKKLGYPEPDLYVRSQALVPLLELALLWRRKKLDEYQKGLGDSVKKLAFDVVDITDRQFKSKEAKPKSMLRYLVSIFSYIRDLTTDEAKRILKFFEDHEQTEAYFLFIYFAEFKRDESFDSSFFKKKLKGMCKKRGAFRESFSREFWITAEGDNKEKTNNFEKIEQYWKLLFNEYQKEVFEDLYRTLEITLTWRSKYEAHKERLKTAFDKEINYYKGVGKPVQLWEPGREIFKILRDYSDEAFLEVFYGLIKSLNENTHYFWIKDWIATFKSIKPKTKIQKTLYGNLNSILRKMYPEYLES